MREPLQQSLRRLFTLASLLACLLLGASLPRNTAHADGFGGSVSLSIINARTGMLHITGVGLPAHLRLYILITTASLANPNLVTGYTSLNTDGLGGFDQDFSLGVFVCGMVLRMEVGDTASLTLGPPPNTYPHQVITEDGTSQHSLLETLPVVGVCPVTTPSIAVQTSLPAQTLQIAGSGFNIQETVGITISDQMTSVVTPTTVLTTTVRSDNSGAFLATLPLSLLNCGDQLLITSVGGAGSNAAAPPLSYPCVVPIAMPDPSSNPAPAGGASHPAAHVQPAPAKHLTLNAVNSPPTLQYGQVESLHITTGIPNTALSVRLNALGMALATFNLHSDLQGSAQITYRAPMRLKAGQSMVIGYTVIAASGASSLRKTGSFTILGH